MMKRGGRYPLVIILKGRKSEFGKKLMRLQGSLLPLGTKEVRRLSQGRQQKLRERKRLRVRSKLRNFVSSKSNGNMKNISNSCQKGLASCHLNFRVAASLHRCIPTSYHIFGIQNARRFQFDCSLKYMHLARSQVARSTHSSNMLIRQGMSWT